MDVTTVTELFDVQSEAFKLNKFQDELTTMRQLHARPQRIVHDQMSHDWLNSEKASLANELEEKDDNALTQKSHRLRAAGNKSFNGSMPRQRCNALAASNLYTQSVLAAAAANDSAALALAHANRGMALLEVGGYYRQAYDDCVCAMALGYPDQQRHKILARQATCALHLGDVAQAQRHLADLDAMSATLNANFIKQLVELRGRLESSLHELEPTTKARDESPPTIKEMNLANAAQATVEATVKATVECRRKTKIQRSQGSSGRYMVTTEALGEHELIFSDYAAAFVPVNGAVLCQQCAITQLIPFPCSGCRGRVVYCSLKCRAAHAKIHGFECAGYRRDIFANIGVGHVVLRMLLEGLPPVLTLLRDKPNAEALWASLVDEGQPDSIVASDSLAYAETLRLTRHFDGMPVEDVLSYALMADLLVVYLKQFTDFFELTAGSAASRADWELIAAALVLRHIGQFIVNASVCSSLVSLPPAGQPLNFTLLQKDLWATEGAAGSEVKAAPLRIQRGCLHKFSQCQKVAVGNFPYLSICNHACAQSFQSRFSGRFVSTFAVAAMSAGAEITNCYTPDYRKSKREARHEELKEIYNFDCKCSQCQSATPDVEYEKFNRFRCEHPNCAQVFVRESEQSTPESDDPIECTACGRRQSWELLETCRAQLKCVRKSSTCRYAIFEYYNQLGHWFLDYNVVRVALAATLVSDFLAVSHEGARLTDAEFAKLVEICKFALAGIAAQNGEFSLDYVSKLTCLWDLIALGKYKCTRVEWQSMQHVVAILPDELKTIFMNYYEDYIEPVLHS